jgi:Na+-driven multidrug efflux pump
MMSVGLSFADGFCVTASALLGQSMGEKRTDKAQIYVGACQRVAMVGALMLTAIFIGLRYPLIHIYSHDTEIVELASSIMILVGLTTNVQTCQNIYSSALRGAGDTQFVAWMSMLCVMIVRPGLGWLFAYPLGGGLVGAWIACWVDQALRCMLGWQRFRRGKWKSIQI